jgi:hypothetical protein
LECVTDRLMNLCVSVGVFPMSTQNVITALCSTSDVVKNEVCDVIDGDRRLTVREVADKCVISKSIVVKPCFICGYYSIQKSNSALTKLSNKLS